MYSFGYGMRIQTVIETLKFWVNWKVNIHEYAGKLEKILLE